MQAPQFIRVVHPDHGEPVVFTPGELLPEWAAEALQAGRGRQVEQGVIELDSAPRRPRKADKAADS